MLKLIFLLTFFLTIYPFADFNNMALFLPSFYILTLAFSIKFYRSLSLSLSFFFFSFYCFIFHHVMFPFNLYPVNFLLQLLSKPQSVFRTSGSNNSKGWLVSLSLGGLKSIIYHKPKFHIKNSSGWLHFYYQCYLAQP